MQLQLTGRAAIRGVVTVTTWTRHGDDWEPTRRQTFDNLITDAGLDLLAGKLAGETIDATIRAVALGADATAPAAGDVALGDERFRRQVTDRTDSGTGQRTTTVYVAPGQANDFTIEEIGWFAGDDVDPAVAGSGLLVARVNYSRDKTADEALQIDRTDILTRSA